MTTTLAIVCVRNEALHIRRCLRDLIASGLDVHLIDNGSTDGTRDLAQEFLGRGLLAISDLPWLGSFSLSDQLRAKREVIEAAKHEWVMHADADEWHVTGDGRTIGVAVSDADRDGFTCIKFNEAVFVPLPGEDFAHEGYEREMATYYFFQPGYPRLRRAWKRSAGLDNLSSGGHGLEGAALRQYPQDFILRHYIALSDAQVRSKYLSRRFSDEDLARGWHGNRVNISAGNLQVKHVPGLKRMEDPMRHEFDLSEPLTKHFWEW